MSGWQTDSCSRSCSRCICMKRIRFPCRFSFWFRRILRRIQHIGSFLWADILAVQLYNCSFAKHPVPYCNTDSNTRKVDFNRFRCGFCSLRRLCRLGIGKAVLLRDKRRLSTNCNRDFPGRFRCGWSVCLSFIGLTEKLRSFCFTSE